MTFDPFGDFETQGYLRNVAKEKDPEIVRHLEHAAFLTGIDAALERLAKIKQLSYSDLLETHRILFEAVYPWAGQDRRTTAPDRAISRGSVLFAHPDDIQLAANHALTHGQEKDFMKSKAWRDHRLSRLRSSVSGWKWAYHHACSCADGAARRFQYRLGSYQ